MEKIRLEILGLSSSQSQIGSFALVLGEEDGNRRLPIIIGGFEAQAIALEIENIKPNRPMTHDLLVSIARTFEVEMEEVVISDLKEGVFYSRIVLHLNGERKEVDARPSDAIAIAVRFKAPIFTYETILSEAGIDVQESSGESKSGKSSAQEETAEEISSQEDLSKVQRIRKLTDKIEDAISREDYEEAARLRDEINKLEEAE